MDTIETLESLLSHYGAPVERALWKEIDHLNEHYQAFVANSPFVVLATVGSAGVDCSPKGDPAGFVHIESEKRILLPDRRGNNRIDSLKNIVENGQVGLFFMIPGVGETLRIRGRGTILVDTELCERFAMSGKPAKSVLQVDIDAVYFQCQKAIARSGLWNPETYPKKRPVATAGQMTQNFSELRQLEFDGKAYDDEYPDYMKKTLY